MSIEIKDDDHFKTVFDNQKSQPVILFFTASWCGPCQFIKPQVEETAGKLAGKLSVLKIDVDECDGVCEEYGVSSMPTFILIVEGSEKYKFSGGNKEKLQEMFDKALQ